MKFLCGSCRTKYQISDDKVRGKILTIRCKKCGAKILVRESLASGGGTAVAPVAGEVPASPPRSTTSARPQTSSPREQRPRSSAASSPVRGGTGSSARTGGSAALASAFELAMGQGASDSDDMPTSIAPVPANLEIAGVEWYVAIDGAQQGPFAFAEVVKKVEDRQLIGRHYVWHDGMDGWSRIRDMPDLAKYLPSPRSVPPPPPSSSPEEQGPSAEVVELAARRARPGPDLSDHDAEATAVNQPTAADEEDRSSELDKALNEVLGLPNDDAGSGANVRAGGSAASPAPGATQDVEEDMLASDDMFANLPRASEADEVHRESTRFFVAAAGVNKQRKRRRIGLVSGIAVAAALTVFIAGWAMGFFSISLPGIGDPFANMRQGRSPTEAGPADELSAKELALLKGKKERERKRRRRRPSGRNRDKDSSLELGGDYVDQEGSGAGGRGPRGLTEEQRIGIGSLGSNGVGGPDSLPEAELPTSSPDLPVVDQANLTQEAVATVVRQNSMSVRFCYQQSLKGSKNLRGKLQIKLRVEPSGRVSRTEIETSQFKGTTLAKCIRDKVRKWTFPKSKGEAKEFLVPFVFEKGL